MTAAASRALARRGEHRLGFTTVDGLEIAALTAIALAAFLVRIVPVLRGGGLDGLTSYYDDGVYFGSALALVNGRVPYRDFLLLHPPGILYVYGPIAALARVVGDPASFALARFAVIVLGVANAILVWAVARRLGRAPALAAAALYAVWAAPLAVERSTWLGAPQNTLLLLGLLVLGTRSGRVLSPRRAALAGALFGLDLAIQVWNVVPVAVVAAWLLVTPPRPVRAGVRRLVGFGIGVGITCLGVCLPFVVLAPATFLRYVIVDQVGRLSELPASLGSRLALVAGLPTGIAARAPEGLLVAAALAVVAVLVATAVRLPAARLWIALFIVQGAFLLAISVIFGHYAAWPAPAGALSFGAAVAAAAGLMRAGTTLRRAAVPLMAVVAVVLAGMFVVSLVRRTGARFTDAATIRSAVTRARCVTADSPLLLIATDTLGRDAVRGCPLRLDPTGLSYDTGRSLPPGSHARTDDPAYQAAMRDYYTSGEAALFSRSGPDRLRAATWAAIRRRLPVRVATQPFLVLLAAPTAATRAP